MTEPEHDDRFPPYMTPLVILGALAIVLVIIIILGVAFG